MDADSSGDEQPAHAGRTPDLIVQLRKGNPAALHSIYQSFKDDIISAAAAVLGRRSGVDPAWDVLHDVFVALARVSHTLSPEVNLRAYLVRAAVNRARDHLRSRARRPWGGHQDQSVDTLAAAMPACPIESDEQATQLFEAVRALPPAQRVVVSLHIWGEMSFAQIAEQEQVSRNTVESRWRYAIGKLQRQYAKEVRP